VSKTPKPFRFSGDWVYHNLDLRRGGRYPAKEARVRIAYELNKLFRKNNPWIDTGYWPHFLRLPPDAHERIRRGDTEISHPNKRDWLWYGFVLSMAEMIRAELVRAKVPGVGYSAKGPVVKFLTKAIPLITCETPTRGAVAKEIERQRKLKLCDKAAVISHTE
jgi:hypothetical protein